MAPQLARVRGSVEQLARLRYNHPSLDLPEPSLLGVMERLTLVVSELGGNALRHGHAPITVVLARLRGGWLLTVSDGAPDRVPVLHHRPGHSARDGAGGSKGDRAGERASERASERAKDFDHRRGLEVVALVSAEAGWYADENCKHVWANVPDQTPPGLSTLIRV